MKKSLNIFLALFFAFSFTFDANLAQAGRRSPYDLGFNRYEIDQSSVLPGDKVSMSVVVQNTGRSHLNSGYTLAFYFSESGQSATDGERVGYRNYRRRLKRNRTRGEQLNFTVPNNVVPGKYQLHAVLDPDQQLDESNENNNTQSFDIEVLGERVQLDPENYADNILKTTTVNRYGPDVVSYGLDYDRAYLHAGDKMRLSMRLRNVGRNSASAGKVYWHFGPEKVYTLSTKIGESDYGYMRRRRYSSTRYDFTVPANTEPGVYYLSYWLDATNTSVEKNEENNAGSVRLAVMPADVPLGRNNKGKTDLAAAVSLENTMVQPGQSVKGILQIKNQGLLNAESGYYYLSFSPRPMDFSRDYLLANGKRFSKISVGDSVTRDVGTGVSLDAKPGTYYFNYKINGSREFNPKNNEGYVQVTVQPLPEAVASGISFGGPDYATKEVTLNKTEIKPGDGGKFVAYVTNIGTEKAGRNDVYFYLSQNLYDFSGQHLVCRTWHDGISHGSVQSEECHFKVSKAASAGTYYLYYKIDARNQNDEVREDNNQGHLEFTVLPPDEVLIRKADLYVSSSSLRSTNLKPGQQLELEYEVSNRGRTTASPVKVAYYLTSDKDDLTNGIGSVGLGDIAFDKSKKGRIKYQIPNDLAEGRYYLILVIDPNNKVDEHSENNNRHLIELAIGALSDSTSSESNTSVPIQAAIAEVANEIPAKPVYRTVRRGADLQMKKVHLNSKVFEPGDSVEGRFDLRNSFRNTARNPVVYLYFGKNFDDLREVNMVKQLHYPNIRRRTASREFEFTVPENVEGGINYLYFFIDPLNAIRERNEQNNFGSLIVNVEVPEPEPQLELVVEPVIDPVVPTPDPVIDPQPEPRDCKGLDKIERAIYGADACLPKEAPVVSEVPVIELSDEDWNVAYNAAKKLSNFYHDAAKTASEIADASRNSHLNTGFAPLDWWSNNVMANAGAILFDIVGSVESNASKLLDPDSDAGAAERVWLGALIVFEASDFIPAVGGVKTSGKATFVASKELVEQALKNAGVEGAIDSVQLLVKQGGGDQIIARLTKTGAIKTITYRSFTAENLRHNLKVLTGLDPSSVYEAHHLFPKKFAGQFETLGINVNDPRFAVWWNRHDHNFTSREYNELWDRILTDDYMDYLKGLSPEDRFFALKKNAIEVMEIFADEAEEIIQFNF